MKKMLISLLLFLVLAVPAFAGEADDRIIQVLDRVKACYEQSQASGLEEALSPQLARRGELLDEFRRDLYGYRDIRVEYAVERMATDAQGTGAVWDIRWEWKAMTREGAAAGGTLETSLRFGFDGRRWLITGVTMEQA